MKKYNMVLCNLIVILVPVLIITLGLNIIFRTTGVYNFYFNDSQSVNRLYVEMTGGEIADEIGGFMLSLNPDEFQIYEDTGFDMHPLFDESDSDFMMIMKKGLDISLVFMLLSAIGTAICYRLLLKWNMAEKLRSRYKYTAAFTVLFMVIQTMCFMAPGVRGDILSIAGCPVLEENSTLVILLGHEFIVMAMIFLVLLDIILFMVMSYITYKLTKPDRIFFG